MAKRRLKPDPFVREYSLQISPRVTIKRGDEIKIKGIKATSFVFESLVTNPANGVQWIDCFEIQRSDRGWVRSAWRSFYPDRIKPTRKKRA